jgi:hypothetical protein
MNKQLNPFALKFNSREFSQAGMTLTGNWTDLVRTDASVSNILVGGNVFGFYLIIAKTGNKIPFFHSKEVKGVDGEVEYDLFLPVPGHTPEGFKDMQIKIYNEQSY